MPVVLEQIAILDFAAEAKCIAKVNDEVIFVQGPVAPGDIADLRILKSKRVSSKRKPFIFSLYLNIGQKLLVHILVFVEVVNGSMFPMRLKLPLKNARYEII